ncbi:hypothetical protein [Legionella sp.]|uniref:hypothetical protein n=1 Tax=Legionella sp. TaxID=459 RepID=UPI003CA5F436
MSVTKANKCFEDLCDTLINKAKPVLERDLSWGDYLTNLLKAFANAIIKIVLSSRQLNTFFKPIQSESILAAEEAQLNLKKESTRMS